MDKKKLKDTYNKIAEDWHKDHEKDVWWVGGTDKFISLIKKSGRVLDVGCAGGTKSKYFISKGLEVLGIDFSENLIEIAKREVPKGEFRVLDVNDLDTLEESFDGIFMQAVLLHIPRKEVESVFTKAVDKLKTGGYLYVAVKDKIEGGTDEEVKKENDYGYDYERFFSYFSVSEMREYFENSGLKIIYEDVLPSTRTARKSNWIQIIGVKN